MKRRWRCADPDCDAKSWTEGSPQVPARALLTVRAGAEATRQVGELALPVAVVAKELGVCWWTVMDAVVRHGTPLVDDPARVGYVRALGIDETSFLSATRDHHTIYATGLVDLDGRILIDMIEGNGAADLRRWCRGPRPALARGRGGGRHRSRRELPARDRRAPRATPCASPIRSMSCGLRTAASTRCAGGSRTRRSGTVAGRPTRSIESESCSSRALSASTSAATSACCSGCAVVIPRTSSSAPGWPRSRCATST